MSATTTETKCTTCKTCRHYEEYAAAPTSGECKHWSGVTGPTGLSVTTAEEWTCSRWAPESTSDNPWPTAIELDGYHEGEATSQATDDYFAGYPTEPESNH